MDINGLTGQGLELCGGRKLVYPSSGDTNTISVLGIEVQKYSHIYRLTQRFLILGMGRLLRKLVYNLAEAEGLLRMTV